MTSQQKRSYNNNRKNHNKELCNFTGQSSGKSVKVNMKMIRVYYDPDCDKSAKQTSYNEIKSWEQKKGLRLSIV